MAADFVIESNLPEVAARLEAMAARAPLEAEMALGRLALEVKETYLQFLRGVTPRETGGLADSSDGEVAVEGLTATITARQTKTVPWRNHGDFPLARLMIDGTAAHPIDALGEANGGKEALYWPGAAHPVRHVDHPGTAARDYPTTAMENAMPDIQVEIDAAAVALAHAVVDSGRA